MFFGQVFGTLLLRSVGGFDFGVLVFGAKRCRGVGVRLKSGLVLFGVYLVAFALFAPLCLSSALLYYYCCSPNFILYYLIVSYFVSHFIFRTFYVVPCLPYPMLFFMISVPGINVSNSTRDLYFAIPGT